MCCKPGITFDYLSMEYIAKGGREQEEEKKEGRGGVLVKTHHCHFYCGSIDWGACPPASFLPSCSAALQSITLCVWSTEKLPEKLMRSVVGVVSMSPPRLVRVDT